MNIPTFWFTVACVLQFTLGFSTGYGYDKGNIKPVCFKPTFKDAEHTWHVVKCPFKGDK